MKGFIINADDYGMAVEVNEAIDELSSIGCISSTSLMANMPYTEQVKELMKSDPDTGVGVHLTLTQGNPLSPRSEVPSLVNSDGEFFSYQQFMRKVLQGRISLKQCRIEICRQIEKARELTNDKLDHWNTHQGIHRIEPLYSVFLNACRKMGVSSMRIHKHYWINSNVGKTVLNQFRPDGSIKSKCIETYYRWLRYRADKFFNIPRGILVLNDLNQIDQLAHVENEFEGVYEIVCHPATNVAGLKKTSMLEKRVEEYKALKRPEVIRYLEKSKRVEMLKSFRALNK